MMISDKGHRQAACVRRAFCALGVVLLAAGGAGPAAADEPTFEQVLPMMNTTALLERGGVVLRGLAGGGILAWDRANPAASRRWTSGDELSGNSITDLAWTGQNVWVATSDGGLTRVMNADTRPDFRRYSSNLGSLDITAVTGTVIGQGERVFYGMDGLGVGQINSGIPGNVYTREIDGLISDDVTTLQMLGSDLFVGTPAGISRFANNEFTDQNAGLASLMIRDLFVDGGGRLLVAAGDGVYTWDAGNESWSLLGDIGPGVHQLAGSGAQVYARGRDMSGSWFVREWDGAAWNAVGLPHPVCTAIAAGDDFWVGGLLESITPGGRLVYNYLGRLLPGGTFDTVTDIGTQVANSEGVAIAADGSAWMGDRNGFQITRYNPRDDSFLFLYEVPHAGNDTLNLFPGRGPVLSIAATGSGNVYASQFAGGGVLKFDPATRTTDLIDTDNSGLEGRHILNLVEHPDGSLIVLHNASDAQRVEILVGGGDWTGTANWVLPRMDRGLGAGDVWDALVERNDIIWFAVSGGGLVRWDINGPDAGPADPLTWFDPSDDAWYDPVLSFPEPDAGVDVGKTVALARGRDGSLWAGGSGLVRFTYTLAGGTALAVEVVQNIQEKTLANPYGLINGKVNDLAVDANGDVWVATAVGLNRVHPRGESADIAAWMDLANYLSKRDYGLLYSSRVIAPLPGRAYARLAAAPDGRQVLLSADQGATLITVGSGPGPVQGADPLAGIYCYPNPWAPNGGGSQLKIGGFQAGTVKVNIYNLDGQEVFRDNAVSADNGFWEGENVMGNSVASGMYVLKISLGGRTTTRALAVVR